MLIVVLTSALLLLPSGLTQVSEQCADVGTWVSTCASNSGSQVDISGTQTKPGTPSRPNDHGGDADPTTPADPAADDCATELCRDSYEVVGIPDITLADLASFVPARPSLRGEPDGVGIVGMPANLVAAASEQRIPGTLFDFDVVVRFVPAGFRFDYGDGTTRFTATGGASWSSLRQADFTPTATSHVYRARGTYGVGVTVLYAPSVDFGAGWIPVDGFVEASTADYSVRVVEVHTALVDKTCLENPRGPGC